MGLRFKFNGRLIQRIKTINILENNIVTPIPNIFGQSLKNSYDESSKGVSSNFWSDSAEGQALATAIPSFSGRNSGGTSVHGSSRNASYNGEGYRYHVDQRNIPFKTDTVNNSLYLNSQEKEVADKSIQDELEEVNFKLAAEAGFSNYTNSGLHAYVSNYHEDWNGSSYTNVELDAALTTGHYEYAELGNEYNSPKYRMLFPTGAEISVGGKGFDDATKSYIVQSRDYYRNKSQYVRTNFPAIKILICAPPPQHLLYTKFGIDQSSWSQNEIRNKNYTDQLVQDLYNGQSVCDGWVHHIYNGIGEFASGFPGSKPGGVRNPTQTMAQNAIAFDAKVDVSGRNLGHYPFFGLRANYTEYIWRNYVEPYEEAYPGLEHTITEWGMGNDGTGTRDTMIDGLNIMKYLLAFNRVNVMIGGRLTFATHHKWLSVAPKSIILTDRGYSLSLIHKAEASNILGATDFQATVGYFAFELFKPVEGGNYLGSIKSTNTNSIKLDEDVSLELFEDTGGNKFLFYANVSDTDITVNVSGTNTYVTGDGAGTFSGNSITDKLISGTQSGDGLGGSITGYPMISIVTAGADSTLRAKTFGRIEL